MNFRDSLNPAQCLHYRHVSLNSTFYSEWWGPELRSSHLSGKHFVDWAIAPVSLFVFDPKQNSLPFSQEANISETMREMAWLKDHPLPCWCISKITTSFRPRPRQWTQHLQRHCRISCSIGRRPRASRGHQGSAQFKEFQGSHGGRGAAFTVFD